MNGSRYTEIGYGSDAVMDESLSFLANASMKESKRSSNFNVMWFSIQIGGIFIWKGYCCVSDIR
jgi:hypothetical protein